MDLTNWAFYAFIAAAVIAAAFAHYRRREPLGRGRHVLAALRGLVLALLVLLLFDPRVPAATGADTGRTLVLLDASLSMRMPAEEGGTRWDAARRAAAELASDRVLLFGGADAAPADSLAEFHPSAPTSRLEPALRAAAEGGASRVVVLTDAGIEDAAEAGRLLETLSMPLEVRRVGGEPPRNVGIVSAEAPPWIEVGEEAVVRVELAALGGAAGDTVTVVLRRGERELARSAVEVPPGGRLAPASLRFTPRTASAVPVRLDIRLEADDAVPDDDARSVYVRISDQPAGVVLVSFRPDQEPRFLLPVLERVLGLPARGWMALAGGRYIRLGVGREAGLAGEEADVRAALEGADLVVLHGLGPAAPEWAQRAAAEQARVLVFPAGGDVAALPFPPGPERPGDWYPSPEIPTSPVAPLMAGVEPGDAPPLTALRTPDPPTGFWAPLSARAGRRGAGRPVVLAGTRDGGRVAVALGDGYWRWAFAGGAARELYDRLWSAVGGWLIAEAGGVAEDAVRPVARAVPRGERVRFMAPAGADSLRVTLEPGTPDPVLPGDAAVGGAVVDTVVPLNGGVATLPALEPGHYRYRARALGAAGAAAEDPAEGDLTVESFSPEFTRAAVALEPGTTNGAAGRTAARAPTRRTRPLRTSPWPYVALVLLLCGEWVLRRRWGLR